MGGITLRKFPYPYRCALAICSDIDGTFRDQFLGLHKFLNTARDTKWGPGLGLEIGDSFWMYSAHPDTDDAWTYFEGSTSRRSENSELIKKFVQSGYIDCLHTFGQFSQKGGFLRSMAVSAIKELIKEGMRVSVWINHGDHHNFQNIGGLGWGDLPESISADGTATPSLEYHTDVTIPYGIRFVWSSDLTSILGQDRPYGVREHYFSDGVLRHPRRLLMVLWYKLVGRKIPLPEGSGNELLRLVTLRDGRKVYAFRRFGHWGEDHIDHLRELLSEENLEELKKVQGYMITFLHMGKSYSRDPLPESSRTCLRRLADQFRAGSIYVVTTVRLLQYNLTYHNLLWEPSKKNSRFNIDITGIRDEIIEKVRVPTLEELQGVTFYTPDAERTEVSLNGTKLKIMKNPPDYSGHESVMIPVHPLVYPNI